MKGKSNKQERRKARREKNRENQEKHIESQIARGKLMWENTNGQDFSPEWINSQLPGLVEGIEKGVQKSREEFMAWIMHHKEILRDIILYWPDDFPHPPEYSLIKMTIENYWDNTWKINDVIRGCLDYCYAKKKESTKSCQKS